MARVDERKEGCGLAGIDLHCNEPASFYLVCWTCVAKTPACAAHAMALAVPAVDARCHNCGQFLAPHIYPIEIGPS